MEKRLNLFIRVFALALVMAAVPLFFSLPGSPVWLIASVAIAMAIALIAIVAASERVTAIRTGMPLEDELSRKATRKAGYYAFVTGLWLAIGIMIANIIGIELLKLPEIEFRYAFEAMIIVPSIVFVALVLYFKNRGKVE